MKCPKLLKSTYYKIGNYDNTTPRLVTDYEIDYYLSGNRTIFIDNKKFTIEPNSLVFKKPGQVVSGIGIFNCYMLTLDFSNTKDSSNYKRNNPGNMQELLSDDLITHIPSYFKPQHSTEIKNLLQLLSIYSEQAKKGEFDSIIMEVLCLIFADSYCFIGENHTLSNDLTYICRYMQKHYNDDITIEELAAKIHLNKSYFIRKFKAKFGVSPLKYLISIKLSNAKIFLQDTNYTIEEIALLCGFCSSSHFSLIFKREFGITPGEYRNRFQLKSQSISLYNS